MKQETSGKVKKAKGQVKEAVGIITGNAKLELEGSRLFAEGEAQERVSTARRERGTLASGAARQR